MAEIRTSVPATKLVAILMEQAGIASMVITERDISRVERTELEIASHATDPRLREGAYRLTLRHPRTSSGLIVPTGMTGG